MGHAALINKYQKGQVIPDWPWLSKGCRDKKNTIIRHFQYVGHKCNHLHWFISFLRPPTLLPTRSLSLFFPQKYLLYLSIYLMSSFIRYQFLKNLDFMGQ